MQDVFDASARPHPVPLLDVPQVTTLFGAKTRPRNAMTSRITSLTSSNAFSRAIVLEHRTNAFDHLTRAMTGFGNPIQIRPHLQDWVAV